MISHYFKLALKTLIKNRYYTFINVFGLVCGMLSALIIAKYVGGSLQFDRFHTNGDRIFSLIQTETANGNPPKESNGTYWGAGDLLNQYPEVSNFTRYSGGVESLVQTDAEKGSRISFVETRIFTVDSGFLKIFTFPLLYGNAATALSRVNSVVLTDATSKRYFGNANPVGRMLTMRAPWGALTTYEVTGVTDAVPKRSRFGFDFLVTQSALDPMDFWTVPDSRIFVLLKTQEAGPGLAGKLTAALDKVAPLKSTNRSVVIALDPMSNAHLLNTEYLLIAVGIFIVLISWANYLNQIIAQSYLRVKQVGILRVMGSTKANLVTQFVVESGLICLTSLVLIILIYWSLEPMLQSLTDGHLLPLTNDTTPINLVFFFIFIAGIVLTAFAPTVILFTQQFATALRNGFRGQVEGLSLRKVLVVVQFSISMVLMISIFVVSNQLDYMRSKDKGISIEDVLIVKDPIATDSTWKVTRKALELFKAKCAALPFVSQVTSSTIVPGEEYRHETYLSFEDNEKTTLVHQVGVGDRFFELYDAEFLAGHNFLQNAKMENRKGIILNESAARAFGVFDLDKMIGSKITDRESDKVYELIGVVKDYHQTSLKYPIKPMAFKFNEFQGHFSLKINRAGSHDGDDLQEKFSAIRQIWQEVYHDAAFDCFFLDEKFQAQDAEDRSFGKLFQYFTILSIVISCLGLFGLSLLISTRRNREVGIRKSFGATSTDILTLFLKGYFNPLVISVLIGSPLAVGLMNIWLRSYSYRVEIGLWPVLVAIVSLTVIFLVTVSYHTIKSSLTDPVSVLRD